jgi:ribonucleoside-diphosphate reductase alpha chain
MIYQTHKLAKDLGWTVDKDFPTWGNNSLYLTTIRGGYLQKSETPRQAYDRLAKTASTILNKPELEDKFFEILWNGWLIPSTPVMANLGNSKGFPISCFGGIIGDDMYEIGRKNAELMMLSKNGGGTAYDFSEIRAMGTPIRGGEGGTSDGIIPFMKMFDSTILASKQSNVRRGAVALYLDIEHPEVSEFLRIRQPKGDINRQCTNIHQAVKVSDEFMNRVNNRESKAIELWKEVQKTRVETGEPYIFYTDNVNRNLPDFWKKHGLKVKHSQLCSEICLPTDHEHTFVCCLSSLNLTKYDEWKDTDTIFLSTLFLDAVISEFLNKAENVKGIEDTVRFAKKSRALGLGVQGYHSYIQSKGIPFVGIQSNAMTRIIFGNLQKETIRATEYLAKEYGEPEWCEGSGRRNLTLTTVAPTKSSSKLSGGNSEGIEPIMANIYLDDGAKGNHIRRNPNLEVLLTQKGQNTNEVWDSISDYEGSVQHLSFLSKDEKDVFLTFREINQLELVKLAGIRQQYLEQSQSLNLAFFQDASAKWINKVHITAWESGVKTLYYLKSKSSLKVNAVNQRDLYSECLMCEG